MTTKPGNAPQFVVEYSPVTGNVTAAVNPSSLTVSDTDDFLPGATTTNSASRYWTLTEAGSITADLSFTYTDADVNGTEADYKVLKRENNATVQFNNSVNDPNTNTSTINGVSEFSQWSVGNAPSAPRAAQFLLAVARSVRAVALLLERASR